MSNGIGTRISRSQAIRRLKGRIRVGKGGNEMEQSLLLVELSATERAVWDLVKLWLDASYVSPAPPTFWTAWSNIKWAVYGFVFPTIAYDTDGRKSEVAEQIGCLVLNALIDVQYPGYESYERC